MNGHCPFTGNIIPTSRLNPDGMKILNWYPEPNQAGVDPGYNYQTQVSNQYPRREEVYRGDYNITDKWKTYFRYTRSADETKMWYGQWNASYNIPLAPMSFGAPGWSWVANVTTIVNPTLTNEFVFGSSRNDLHITPVDDTWNLSNVGVSYKMPYPNADTLGLVQNWNYGGVPNGPTSSFNGTPFLNYNHTIDITDSMAKVWGAHTIKGGFYLHHSAKDQTAFTSVNGTIWFDRDANNPYDANWAFSNAALGNYDRLQQSSVVLNGQYRSWNVEWYIQDNWRVNRKLTLDYGIRFYYIQPQYDAGHANVRLEQVAVRSGERGRPAPAHDGQWGTHGHQSSHRRNQPGGLDRFHRQYRQGLRQWPLRQRHWALRSERLPESADLRPRHQLCPACRHRLPGDGRRP